MRYADVDDTSASLEFKERVVVICYCFMAHLVVHGETNNHFFRLQQNPLSRNEGTSPCYHCPTAQISNSQATLSSLLVLEIKIKWFLEVFGITVALLESYSSQFRIAVKQLQC